MSDRLQLNPSSRTILRLADRRGWLSAMASRPATPRPADPRPARPGSSISSAWLRFAGDRPKLAVVRVRS